MKMNKFLRISLLSMVASNIICAHENKEYNLNKVTVIANKIEENILNVPQSISVISQEIIEEKGIDNISDILNEIQNTYINPDFGGAINFRGLNTSFISFNNPIIIYIDGIATGDSNAFDISLNNVERIEVLRGPQSTLYGKDAIGGVINIVSKKPTNNTSGSVAFEYASNNYMKGTFNLNTPFLNDKIFFNLNAEMNLDDGWVTNNYDKDNKAAKEKEKNLSTSLLYNITDNVYSKLVIKKEKEENYWGNYSATIGTNSLSDFTRSSVKNTSFDMPVSKKIDIDTQSLSLKYENDDYTIQSISTHRNTNVDTEFDFDFQNDTVYDGSYMQRDIDTDTIAQEIRISSDSSKDSKWLGGIYLEDSEVIYNPYLQELYVNGLRYISANVVSTNNTNTKSIFGQGIIALNDKIELTLGTRYQKIEKNIDMTVTNYTYGVGTSSFDFESEKSWNVFLPKVALSYKVDDNISAYVSISKGYMPGGFNSFATSNDVNDNSFEAQKSINYELGIKGVFEKFSLNASVFRMNIKDIHVYRQESGFYYTDNAKKAHSQGIELDFNYFPNDVFEVNGALGFIDTNYDSYDAGDFDFSGNNIEQTPSHTINLSFAYHNPNGLYARTDIKHQGATYFYDDSLKDFLKNDSYTLLNAKIGYKFSDWDTYMYVTNLTDEEYLTFYQSNSVVSLGTYGDSRIFGIGVKYKF